jgi:hypothetical protein
LGAILGVPPLETLLEWNLAQLPAADGVTRAAVSKLLQDVRGASEPATAPPPQATERSVPLDDVIVFNRSHLRVFSSDPAYRDIFTYVNSFGPESVSDTEISQALGLSLRRTQEMLEKLNDLGVVALDGSGRCRAAKRNFYFPDDEDFFGLRNINFEHNAGRILARLTHGCLKERRAYRGLVTRELTAEQVALLLGGIDQLMARLVAMPETSDPRTIYSLCVLFGERFSRAGAGRPGLRSEPATASWETRPEQF